MGDPFSQCDIHGDFLPLCVDCEDCFQQSQRNVRPCHIRPRKTPETAVCDVVSDAQDF